MEPFIALALIAIAFVAGFAFNTLVLNRMIAEKKADAAARAALSDFARRGAAASNAKQAARRSAERQRVLDTAAQMRAEIDAKRGSQA